MVISSQKYKLIPIWVLNSKYTKIHRDVDKIKIHHIWNINKKNFHRVLNVHKNYALYLRKLKKRLGNYSYQSLKHQPKTVSWLVMRLKICEAEKYLKLAFLHSLLLQNSSKAHRVVKHTHKMDYFSFKPFTYMFVLPKGIKNII